MGRIILSVLAGYAAIGLMVVLTDQVAARTIPGFSSMTVPPDYYFYVSLATDTLYTVIGGYLCAAIAREHTRRAVPALIVLGELIGAASQIALWSTVPHWFGIALLLVYPPAIWAGSKLRAGGGIAAAAKA